MTLTPAPPAGPTRIVIIGAGSRGNAYARAITTATSAKVVAVCEPRPFVRDEFGHKYIWGLREPAAHETFDSWTDFVVYERRRREREAAGKDVEPGVHAAIICVLDEWHVRVVEDLQEFNLHVLCEKPLATTLNDVLRIWRSLKASGAAGVKGSSGGEGRIFGIGHVLRYSPHNMLLRALVLGKDESGGVVGDIMSVEHTEPIGWWHFAHSYVRGNWRKESNTAPSLMTKSCHDLDWLLWMLCSPPPYSKQQAAHLPKMITSSGALKFFRKARKPTAAGSATNCMTCPIENSCMYSAKKIYYNKHLQAGDTGWPVKIATPEIEDLYRTAGAEAATERLMSDLSIDYGPLASTAQSTIDARSWYGRCVWEADNDVCDDQTVTITWDDDSTSGIPNRGPKTAMFHMVAFTEAICERRGKIYGTKGEITYDSTDITVHDFATGQNTSYHTPRQPGEGHGGGDDGLAQQFVGAVDAVRSGKKTAEEAQIAFIGCTLEECVRSHLLVFAAEEARKGRKVVDWEEWWEKEVEEGLKSIGVERLSGDA